MNRVSSKGSAWPRVLSGAPAALLAATLASGSASAAEGPLTRVGDVLRLTPRELRLGHPVDLRAVVTLSDPLWGLLAVQDETGGIQVDVSGLEAALSHGDEVRVTGFTSQEGLSPVVVLARVERSGGRHVPECRPTLTAAGLADETDARCVEVAATLRAARPIHEARWRLELDLTGKRIEGVVLDVNELGFLSAGEAIVVRGVPLPVRTARPRGEEVGVRLFAQGADAVRRTRTTSAAVSASASVSGAEVPLRTLRTVMEVKSLDASEARRGQPVRIRGVVTLASADGMSLFLQDAKAAVYVGSAEAMAPPAVGSLIEVVGTTRPGFVAPIVEQVRATLLGPAPLPHPLRAEAIERPLSAATENAWIELSGVLRRSPTEYSLCTAGRELSLHPVRGDSRTLASLVDAEVTVQGVLGAEYRSGELVGRRILVELPRGVEVVRPPPAEPYALPSEPIPRLIAYRPQGIPVHRVRTTGVVTGVFFPNRLFLSDGQKGVACQVRGPADAEVGEVVDVVGFLPADGAQRRLADVLVRRRGPGSPVAPLSIDAEDLRVGEFAAMLVRVTAALRRRHHELGREHLFMEDGRAVFEAVLELPRPDRAVDAAHEGSILRLTGVCEAAGQASPAAAAVAQPCKLLLRSPADLEVLRAASWWTRERALGVLGLMTLFATTVVAWVVTLGRRVARQTATIRQQVEEEAALRDRLRQAEKMESIGRLAGGVAHDFNNLLTGILGYCELLLKSAGMPDRAQRRLGEIKKAAERAADLTRQLLAFSRKQVLEPRVLDLNSVVTDLAPFLRRLVGEDISIQTVLSPQAGRVEADPGQIQQVLLNLVSNARDAMPDGGRLLIETGNVDLDDSHARQRTEVQAGPYVLLSVTDTGAGMSPDVTSRIFEPFFTTKGRGRGTGLGLATVEGIVKQSRGHVGVYSEPGHGSTFRVYLPRVDAAESSRPAAVAPTAFRSAAEVILLVEDEEIVTQVTSAALGEAGYRVLQARDGDEAIRLAATCPAIHLLLTDVILAGPMNGRQLADRLNQARPGLRTLFMSGYTDNVILRQGLLEPGVEFLSKPFTPDTLCRRVREVLDR